MGRKSELMNIIKNYVVERKFVYMCVCVPSPLELDLVYGHELSKTTSLISKY